MGEETTDFKVLLNKISRSDFHVENCCMFFYELKANNPNPAEGAESMTMLK